jgi:pimeloyl-ACP methyl ester carboxylesterase
MLVVFVHGMGRTPLSGWPLLYRLRRAGLQTTTFGYTTAFEDFNSIKRRLMSKISKVAEADRYVLIGHSLGGVLIRAALNELPDHIQRPYHVFLLGSPIQPSRLAVRFRKNSVYRVLSGDCGQLLASRSRMEEVGPLKDATTSIVGVRGFGRKQKPFGDEPNDGVVSVTEVSAPWVTKQRSLPLVHTLLPASGQVAAVILEEIERDVGCKASGV